MRRWYQSAALLAGLVATSAHAQYVVIQVYNGGEDAKPAEKDRNNQGAPGGGPGGGFGAGTGGGFAPGTGAGGGMGAGAGGRMGAGGGGRPGAGLGSGGGSGMGFGGSGGAGPKNPNANAPVDFETSESYVIVAVELYGGEQMNDVLNVKQYHSVWGRTALNQDGVNILVTHVNRKTPRQLYQENRRKLDDRKEKSSTDFLALAKSALNHGLIAECDSTLDELAKHPPGAADAHASAVMSAFQAMKKGLAEPLMKGAAFAAVQKKMPAYGSAESKSRHYSVFYANPSASVPDEVTNRLDLLEQNMHAYYLWFVLQGKSLPMPQEQLIAVLVPDAGVFKQQRMALDMPPGVDDALFSKRDNVVVFSLQRLDESFQIFAKMVETDVWNQGWKRNQLLEGKSVPKELRKNKDWRDDYRKFQTLALAHKALEHEAELAAVTHEGSLQLAIASGLYPSSVAVPEWASFGFASLFDTPKGPYQGATGIFKTALWPGYGAPNWAYMEPFKIWAKSKDPLVKLEDPATALKKTVTDNYFQNIRKEIKEDIDPTLSEDDRKLKRKEIARAKEDQLRARAQAWSLIYYLANYHLDEMMAYFQQLSAMPRDLELDEQTMLLSFARACKLTSATGAIDQAKLSAFADNWFKTITNESRPGDGRELDLTARAPRSTGSDNSNGPGTPGSPGRPGAPPGRP